MPKPLGEIVIDAGLAPRESVVEAARIADQRKQPLVVVLVRQFGVDELGLVAAVRKQARVPVTDPAAVTQDPDAIRELSRDTCRRLRVLPLALSLYDAGPRILSLAMADPTDAVTVAEVEHLSGCEVRPTLMPLSTVEELVERCYGAFVTEVMPRPGKSFGPAVDTQVGSTAAAQRTVPFHRISDEADLELRHRALLALLYDKKLISEDEYEEQVRELMKRREDAG